MSPGKNVTKLKDDGKKVLPNSYRKTSNRLRKLNITPDKKQSTIKDYFSPQSNLKTSENLNENKKELPKCSNESSIQTNNTDKELKKHKRVKRNKIKLKPCTFSSDSENEDFNKNKKDNEFTLEVIKKQWEKQNKMLKINKEVLKLAEDWEKQNLADNIIEDNKKTNAKFENSEFSDKSCKHLSDEQLKQLFAKDIEWLDTTFEGIRPCVRHEEFKNKTTRSNDMMYNVSCEVFSEKQQLTIIGLFRERYDKGNLWKNSDYYWKVLLPEYCLKIFMEEHKLVESEAMRYLNNIPVPIQIYFKDKK